MTEAMKTLDAGMIAAELEVKASSRALPVTGPACNADGTPAASSAESAVSASSSAAVARFHASTNSGPSRVDRAADDPSQVNSNSTAHVAEPDMGSSSHKCTSPGQPQNADRENKGVVHASKENAVNELDPLLCQTNCTSAAVTSSSASQTPSQASTAAGTSVNVLASSALLTSAYAAQTTDRKEPSLDPAPDSVKGIGKVSTVVAVHADASSSNSSMQPAPAQPTASAEPPASRSDNQLRQGVAHQQTVQGTSSVQFSQSPLLPLSQPAAGQQSQQASLNVPQSPSPTQASASSQSATGSTAAQHHTLCQGNGDSVAASARVQPGVAGDAAVLQPLPAATCPAGAVPASTDSAAVQQVAVLGVADVSQSTPAWFAEEGHFALMLQDFVVSPRSSAPCRVGIFAMFAHHASPLHGKEAYH